MNSLVYVVWRSMLALRARSFGNTKKPMHVRGDVGWHDSIRGECWPNVANSPEVHSGVLPLVLHRHGIADVLGRMLLDPSEAAPSGLAKSAHDLWVRACPL